MSDSNETIGVTEEQIAPGVKRVTTDAEVEAATIIVGNLQIGMDKAKGFHTFRVDGEERRNLQAFTLRWDVDQGRIMKLETVEIVM